MKKVTSLLLVLICCLAMSIPAFAVENAPTVELHLPDGDDAEIIAFNLNDSVSFGETVYDLESEGIVPYDYPANAGIVQIIGYPLAIDVDDPSVLFYSSDITASVTFNSYDQYSDLELTYTQAQALYDKLSAALYNYDSTKTYAIVGWRADAYIQVRADNPLYIHWRIAEPNFDAGTDYDTVPVTSNLYTVGLWGFCEFPEGKDNTTTTRFSLKGIDGQFYYRSSTGQTIGIPFAAGITLNV